MLWPWLILDKIKLSIKQSRPIYDGLITKFHFKMQSTKKRHTGEKIGENTNFPQRIFYCTGLNCQSSCTRTRTILSIIMVKAKEKKSDIFVAVLYYCSTDLATRKSKQINWRYNTKKHKWPSGCMYRQRNISITTAIRVTGIGISINIGSNNRCIETKV